MPKLFEPFTCKGLSLKNRVVMPPMNQYAVTKHDGIPNEWHYVHLVSRAIGGTGLIIIEMTHVEERGRITNHCLGLWSDEQIPEFKRIIDQCHEFGAKIAIQIGHAGSKSKDSGFPVSCSSIAFNDHYKQPQELTTTEVEKMVFMFRDAVSRAVKAGVDTIEIHGAHGYLIHQFASPKFNFRDDRYGKDKFLFGEEVIQAAKSVMPDDMPLIMRISAVEYSENGYGLDYAVEMSKRYKEAGVDMIDVSSGGDGPVFENHQIQHPGYQVPLAARLKQELNIPVIAVGKLDHPYLAESVVGNGAADLVAVGRGILRNPYWANEASILLNQTPLTPDYYKRAYY